MNTGFRIGFAAALVTLCLTGSWAQRSSERGSGRSGGSRGGVSSNNGVINFQETNKRNTQKTERDDRKKKEEEERKKKEEEEKRRKEREARWGGNNNNKPAITMGNNRSTSGSKTAGKGGGPATKPVNAGGSSDPTLRDVTSVMYDAVKTQRVDFDPVKAKNTPGILLLNAPRNTEADRIRAGEASIAEPL